MAEGTCLTDEAPRECHSVLNTRTAGDNEVVTDDSHTDMDRSLFLAVDASVLQSRRAFYLAEVTDLYILDVSRIHDSDIRPDSTDGGRYAFHIRPYHSTKS